jgi:hypothetical protein
MWPEIRTDFSLNFWMYMALTMLGRQKCMHLSHYYLCLVCLTLKLLFKHYKGITRQYRSKQEAIHYVLRSTNLLILSEIRWYYYIFLPIYKYDRTVCSNYVGIWLSPTAHKTLSVSFSMSIPYVGKLLGIFSMDLKVMYQVLMTYCALVSYCTRNWNKMGQYTS